MRFSKEIKKLIKKAKISNFPVRLSEIKQIIEQSGWEIYSYNEAVDIIEQYKLQEMVEKNDSFTANIGSKTVILYDDKISQLDFPYILAHEIGHIVLGHFDVIDDIYAKERDCNCFANELLGYIPNHKWALFSSIGTVAVAAIIGTVILINQNNTDNIPVETSSISTVSSISDAVYNNNTVVYITSHGEKYHLAGCRYIENKDNLIEISIENAEQGGYEPCDICFGE